MKRSQKGLALTAEERKMYLDKMREETGLEATTAEESEDCQKIVTEDDLANYLSKGWKVVTTLPSGKIVITNE